MISFVVTVGVGLSGEGIKFKGSCCDYDLFPNIDHSMNNRKYHTMPREHNSKAQLLQQMNEQRTLLHTPLFPPPPPSHVQQQWGLSSKMKKIENKAELLTAPTLREAPQPNDYWHHGQAQRVVSKLLPSNIYYPPTCSGYDMAYCPFQQAIYVYGGIPCSQSLQEGIRPHFYKYQEGKWSEVHPESTYSPTPRYGHTLTAGNRELILFGGVSEYKEKLKDRCFYTDCSAYHTSKNNWRVIETSGMEIKTRKNHAACIYANKYYLVHGGLDPNDDLLHELSWINLEHRRPRWKSLSLPARFNHRLVSVQPDNARHFLVLFGGRDARSEVVGTLLFLPLTIGDGQLTVREPMEVGHPMRSRQMGVVGALLEGFVVLGGIDKNNEVVEDCWYCDYEKQTFSKVPLEIAYGDLRGAKGCSLEGQMIYVMGGNSQNFKALQIIPEK